MDDRISTLRESEIAGRVRAARLVVVLRRIEPRERLLALVVDLAEAGAEILEITFDAPSAAADLVACREGLAAAGYPDSLLGAGTVRTADQLSAARDAQAQFVVSPILDEALVAATLEAGLPSIPGAYSPTEVDRAWRAGATFVKLFPASSLGAAHVRELRGPLGEIDVIPTGGIDASNARAFLDAGAAAVGIGSALTRASLDERRAIIAAVRGTG